MASPVFRPALGVFLAITLVARTGAAQAPPTDALAEANAALQRAAMNGDLTQIAAAIAAHAPIDTPGDSRMTPLGIAALYGRADVIRALAAAGANLGADQDGESALSVAAHEGHTTAVDALVTAGADVSAIDKDGITPLMWAASSNRVGAIRTLLARGADVNATNTDGATALIAAAFGGHAQASEVLLAGGAQTAARDRSGRTALMASALGGNAAVTALLLDHKADPQVEDSNGMNALVYAASTGQDEVVSVLQKAGVRSGADLALAFAVRGCRIPLATSLLSGGASLKADLNGDHLLLLAAGANCSEGVQLLLARGLKVNLAAEDGGTALMRAAGEGNADMAFGCKPEGGCVENGNALGAEQGP